MSDKQFTGKTSEFQDKKYRYVPDGVKGMVSDMQEKAYQKKVLKKIKSRGEEMGVFAIISAVITAGTLAFFSPSVFVWGGITGALFYRWNFIKKQNNRMLNYWNILGGNKQFSIEKLSMLANENKQIVYKDLDKMVELQLFPEYFIDRQHETLVLGNVEEYIKHYQSVAPVEEKKMLEDASTEAKGFLSELAKMNQSIQNAQMTQRISQIQELTQKIYSVNEEKKGKDLNRFSSYYLPTTLKLLSTYAQMEQQNIKGENISKSMAEIEEMMSKVVEGFEKQLDQMFQSETMDISADISVLEQMFEKDGLTDSALKWEMGEKSNKIQLK